MLTRLVVALIRGPLLIFVSLSKVILLLVPVKHIMLSPVQVLKLNIELWLVLLLRCYEFALSFMTWVLMLLILCRCVATMRLLSLLPTILFSMSISNILKLVVTLFKICWCNNRLSLPMPMKCAFGYCLFCWKLKTYCWKHCSKIFFIVANYCSCIFITWLVHE